VPLALYPLSSTKIDLEAIRLLEESRGIYPE